MKEIIDGRKKYEFRKRRPRVLPEKIVIYATSPMKEIVGEVEVIKVLRDTPENIWDLTKNEAGVSWDFFEDYYKDKEEAIAYQLGELNLFSTARTLADYGLSVPPQSFIYLNDIL